MCYAKVTPLNECGVILSMDYPAAVSTDRWGSSAIQIRNRDPCPRHPGRGNRFERQVLPAGSRQTGSGPG